MKLAEVQARFYELVTAPQSVATIVTERGPATRRALDHMIDGGDRLGAVERLDVYAGMYFFRIHDVLRDELPRTAAALGDAGFHNLVVDYLAAWPPRHFSLREAGGRLPSFLSTHTLGVERPWIAELARLERTRRELFDGADAAPLTIAQVRQRPAESLGQLPLRLVPCAALLQNRFAIAPLWRIEDSATLAAAARSAAPSAESIVVWRRDVDVYHRAVDEDEARWLARVQASTGYGGGLSFETLCGELEAAATSDEAAAARAFALLNRWIGDELLAASPADG